MSPPSNLLLHDVRYPRVEPHRLLQVHYIILYFSFPSCLCPALDLLPRFPFVFCPHATLETSTLARRAGSRLQKRRERGPLCWWTDASRLSEQIAKRRSIPRRDSSAQGSLAKRKWCQEVKKTFHSAWFVSALRFFVPKDPLNGYDFATLPLVFSRGILVQFSDRMECELGLMRPRLAETNWSFRSVPAM